MDINQARDQLNQAESAITKYEDANLPTQMNKIIQDAYSPLLQNSVEDTRNKMVSFNQDYMNIPYMGMVAGTDANSLTPQQKMAIMGTRLGQMSGDLTRSQQLSQLLGGNLKDMQAAGMQGLEYARATAKDKYGRALTEYDRLFQAQEAEKQRQFQAQEAAKAAARARASMPKINMAAPNFGGGQSSAPSYVLQAIQSGNAGNVYSAMKQWEKSAGGFNEATMKPFWGAWMDLNYGPNAGQYGQDYVSAYIKKYGSWDGGKRPL